MPRRSVCNLGWLVACVALLAAGDAKAISLTGTPFFNVVGANAADLVEISPITATTTGTGFTLVGDVSLGVEGNASIIAFQNFSVGPLPELLTYDFSLDLKLVVANGDALDPDANVVITSYVQKAGTLVPGLALIDSLSLEGNGFTPYSQVLTPPGGYVLAPASDYALVTTIGLELANQPALLPGEMILEFGGITGYSGFEFATTSTPVPEPATGGLLAVGLAALAKLRRRRRSA